MSPLRPVNVPRARLYLSLSLAALLSTAGSWAFVSFAAPTTNDAGATAVLQKANSQTAPAELAREYLAALAPAGAQITKAEAALKALPPTATMAQVQAIVAPLRNPLVPLYRLQGLSATAVPPGPASGGTSLEALGRPTHTGNGNGSESGSASPLLSSLIVDFRTFAAGLVKATWRLCSHSERLY